MINKIFLDFDGTLVDIKKRHYQVYKLCVERFGGVSLDTAEYWSLKRHDTQWSDILAASKLNPNIENDFLKVFIEKIEDIDMLKNDHLFDDTLNFISSVASRYDIYLVSLRRHHDNLVSQLKHLGIEYMFKTVLSGHSETKQGVLTKKADVIREIDGYGNGIIIGDTEADIAAATKLNIPSIALTTGIRDFAFLNSMNPTYISDSLTEAETYLD